MATSNIRGHAEALVRWLENTAHWETRGYGVEECKDDNLEEQLKALTNALVRKPPSLRAHVSDAAAGYDRQ